MPFDVSIVSISWPLILKNLLFYFAAVGPTAPIILRFFGTLIALTFSLVYEIALCSVLSLFFYSLIVRFRFKYLSASSGLTIGTSPRKLYSFACAVYY